MERKKIRTFPISIGSYESFIAEILALAKRRASANVCLANAHMFAEAYKDNQYQRIINDAEIVTPDGSSLAWSLRLLYGVRQKRIPGMDLLPDLLEHLMKNNLSVFFYGGSQHLVNRLQSYMMGKYPYLNIAGIYSPPFRSLTKMEEEQVVEAINGSGASVVFVVLGCPKQEKWMAAMKGRINAVMIGIGGAVPVMLKLYPRAPKLMQVLGLEWIFRLLQEPKRLYKRYAVTNFLFALLLLKELISIRLLRKPV